MTMGTLPIDLTGLGLAHAAPPAIPVRQARWIDARWEEWQPWCAQFARRVGLVPSTALVPLRVIHRSRVINLLGARVSWAAIRKHRLDNPLVDNEAFEFQLRAASERRRTRMGRKKGVRRKHV
jgi:hypothetical protein